MIVILCGKIAAGKTTYAKKFQKEQNALILSCDDMMLTLFDDCLGAEHDKTAMRCLQYLFTIAEQLSKINITAVIDYGFWLKTERKAAFNYFTTRNIPFEFHYLSTSEEQRHNRLQARNAELSSSENRVYIIDNELLNRLDEKFEIFTEGETYKTINN